MHRFLLLANPRTGSTYLAILLRSHPDVGLAGELLNDEHELPDDKLQYIEQQLSKMDQNFVGFKVFPEQIFKRDLRFDDIIRYIGVKYVVVLWRKSLIEQLISRRIAEKTGNWFCGPEDENNYHIEKVSIDENDLKEYYETLESEWKLIGSQWPTDVLPIFITYEDLMVDPIRELRRIFARMSCDIEKYVYVDAGQRKIQVNPSDRVENWIEIKPELKNLELRADQILTEMINKSLKVRFEALPLVPDREPSMPSTGWRYNVCAPFMPNKAKDNVMNALYSGSLSSAGFWPKQMAKKLKQLFSVPVAQPCSNGFTSLLLAMQSVNIGKGDEVIMPSMTMIAVPNAVYFLGAVPVFAECAVDNYNPGLKEILDAATDKTKAVIITHTYGVPAVDLELTVNECKKRGWFLIEDISECVGVTAITSKGEQQLLGTFGDFACASLYANKIIHAGDGGFVLAKDARLAARLTALVNHGFTPTYHFLHFESAINGKINGLGAALACGCLNELEAVMRHRHQLSQWYRQNLKSSPLKLMPECGPQDTPWVFGIECESKKLRTELRAFLADYGIETRDFFFPLHLQPAFKHISHRKRHFRAEKLGSTGFYLPTYYELTIEDVQYISSAILAFFDESICKNDTLLTLPNKKNKDFLLIKSGSFRIEARTYSKNGLLIQNRYRGHPLIDAVSLGLSAERCLTHERWDECHEFISSVKQCIEDSKSIDSQLVEDYFKPYIEYFSSQSSFEPSIQRPWLQIDLREPEYDIANTVATTSDYETLQLLVWLVKQLKPRTILELGSWMGHSTLLMAIAAQEYSMTHYKTRIYACDVFRWQHWMGNYVKQANVLMNGQSFLPRFSFNTKPFREYIEPVILQYDGRLPDSIENIRPGLVFIDFTQDCNELEEKWKQIEPNLTPNNTIILFNGLSATSIPFFTRRAHQFEAFAKPHTIAKAFRFISPSVITKPIPESLSMRKFDFQTPPDWTHHHKNAFNSVIDPLKEVFHDRNSKILFISSVEEMLCDNPELLAHNSWIGIIHMVPEYPELFYTPDLKRICSKEYSKYMKHCKGLFTLTKVQSEYLRKNLMTNYKIPIQSILYPFIEPDIRCQSFATELMTKGSTVDLILTGSFARDYELFYSIKVPNNIRKVLLIGDELMKEESNYAPKDVYLQNRLNGNEYEKILEHSIVFLSLKYDGAANTLILECIARNIPVLVPKFRSCVEYIGEDYPLLYDTNQSDFTQLISTDNIQKSIDYLQSMDKSRFHIKHFIRCIQNGYVLRSISPINIRKSDNLSLNSMPLFNTFDVTLCICSYKRTHHLSKILNSLWDKQTFAGSIQIIVWNNNESRTRTVSKICDHYSSRSTSEKSLELISCTKNYYCSVRLAMAQLMQSDCLLICDDDIIPGPEFVNFFMTSHHKYPKDVLCLRGHKFLKHELQVENPSNVWSDYENLRFITDEALQQSIHFVHADCCLIPKKALHECASVEMPDSSFVLVDDYWMSFVLNHKFGRNLRKLSTKNLGFNLIERTQDSDQIGLALYTRPEVREAKIQLYIHHMLQGWPHWEMESVLNEVFDEQKFSDTKKGFWNTVFLGFNISSNINETDVEDLAKSGVKCVRIGAVGLGDKIDYEFKGFLLEPEVELKKLDKTCSLLRSHDIKVVLTLSRELASPQIWRLVAQHFNCVDNVIGYDLINEPFTAIEESMHWMELVQEDKFIPALMLEYINIIKAIREVDEITPIIIESTYWANVDALKKLPIESLLALDSSLMVSFHFYEPMYLTQRQKNKKRYEFPGEILVYDNTAQSETILINDNFIDKKFNEALNWAKSLNLNLVVGEFGISREIAGAEQYLKAVMNACRKCRMSSFLFSFRDHEWDSMDYELGTDIRTGRTKKAWDQNSLWQTLLNGIKSCDANQNEE